ncbi:hypothetical protein [Salinibacterium sp. ZJ454]|uniref:hypothetical protein n=1 Tax=Salinibacterium sp. ZJ454 TaxID=2708339 RepID=UPI001420F664|nr:hypothetical protein [Salinibacterium sp. ZJ454]
MSSATRSTQLREVVTDGTARGIGLATWLLYAGLAFVAAFVSIPVFVRLTEQMYASDIMVHAGLAKDIVEQGGWISYSLWYPLVYVLTGGANDTALFRPVSIVLLTASVVLKAVLVMWLTSRFARSAVWGFAIGVFSVLAMPILNPAMPKMVYLGQITPNVWHNSTNILALPFAIIAALAAIALIRKPEWRTAATFGGLIFLSVLTKPNYALALLPVVGIALIVKLVRARSRWRDAFGYCAVAFVPVAVLLVVQYFLVFSSSGVRDARLVFAPFEVWQVFSANIPLSLVLSFGGAVLTHFALPVERRRSTAVVLSWLVVVVAVLEAAMLAERVVGGAISTDGNWFWGAYTATFILLIVLIANLARSLHEARPTKRRVPVVVLALVALVLHVVSGIVYVLNVLETGNALV